MNINEKRQNLEEARRILKDEFIGIDNIIDQIIQSVTPWYLTPEILDRPLVISLWGITGTGKTSIVKRLFEILKISRVVLFDSGELIDKTMLGEMIIEALSLDDSYNTSGCSDTVFVFDEFQHARTIDEKGLEITKPSIRQMWNLIDSGTLVVREFNYNAMKLTVYLEDLEGLVSSNPGIPVEGLEIKDPACVKEVLTSIGLVWYENRAKAIYSNKIGYEEERPNVCADDYGDDEREENKKVEDPFRSISAVPRSVLQSYFSIATRADKTKSAKERFDALMNCKTLDEIYEYLSQIRDSLAGQKKYDFSKSIIFLIGNLDEAFFGADNVDPDLNADLFKRSIDKVTISSIKSALGRRFRAEQIARFGNTMLKYPAFTSENYHDLIRFKLDEVLDRFKKHTGKTITYTQDIVELIYSEGVFPAQGCRPVFTTITNMFTPLLSSALIDFEEDEIEASIVEPEKGFRVNTKEVRFKSKSGKEKIHSLELTLGACRNPENNPLRYVIGVHEAGHAVITSYCTGDLPLSIVSTSAIGGGHTEFARYGDKFNTINKKLLQVEIMSLLGGYLAEKMIFKKPSTGQDETDYVTFGAEIDFETAYTKFSKAAFKLGYFEPGRFACELVTERTDGIPAGIEGDEINSKIKFEFDQLIEKTTRILNANRHLVAKIGKLAAEIGSVGGKDFFNLVDACKDLGDTADPFKLTPERMKIAKEEVSFDRYKTIVLKETEG